MSDLKHFARELRRIIVAELGLPENTLRPANQAAPVSAPPALFGTLYLSVISDGGWAERTYSNDAEPATTITEELTGMQKLACSVQFYRQDALYLAHKLRFRFNATSMLLKLNAAHIGFVKAGPVRDLTALSGQAWEERGQLDIEFHVIAREAATLTTIGSMQPTFIRDQPASTFTTPEITLP